MHGIKFVTLQPNFKIYIMKRLFLSIVLLVGGLLGAHAEVDPNFYIYLCFGQSNMEGNAQPQDVDKKNVDERFLMLATCNFSSPKRNLGEWYQATPPIVSPWGGLGMADYFGRTMVAALPKEVRVGVVDVAIGGIAIEGFMPDKIAGILAKAENWQAERIRAYGSDPYQRLVDMGKKAQEVGVIKGILLHQGCSNNGDPNWPNNVKKIYDNLLKDLNLKAEDVPIFVGETLRQNQGGGCYAHNDVVAKIPTVIPTGHVVSSVDVPGNGQDAWHFNAAGYRIFGKRYAFEALKVMGKETQMDPEYNMPDNLKKFFTLRSVSNKIVGDPNKSKMIILSCTYNDGHTEKIRDAVFTSTDYEVRNGNIITLGDPGTSGTLTTTITDFTGEKHEVTITVEAKGTSAISVVTTDGNDSMNAIYDLQGRKVDSSEQWESLPSGIYIRNGRKVIR